MNCRTSIILPGLYLVLLISLSSLISCSTGPEKQLINFLNNTEPKFNKTQFELVGFHLIDTIYEIDSYKLSEFVNYSEIASMHNNTILDTTVLDTIPLIDQDGFISENPFISWDEAPFSKHLYNYIRYDGDYSTYQDGEFLNQLVRTSYKEFRKKLLNDANFKKQLIINLSNYDYFSGVFSADSLNKFIDLEKFKESQVAGYLYLMKYRNKGVLNEKIVLLDSNNKKIIMYKE